MEKGGPTAAEKAAFACACLIRPPSEKEVERLVKLYEDAKVKFAGEVEKARQFATAPLGPPQGPRCGGRSRVDGGGERASEPRRDGNEDGDR